MRVYWPTTLGALSALEGDVLASGPVLAHAVTPALRDYFADADPRDLEEELEFIAMTDAAEESLRLLAAAGGSARRVVLALDVPDPSGPAPERGAWSGPGRSRVELAGGLLLSQLVSVHVDAEEAEADVRAAIAALPAADAGDEDARFTVESVEGHDLLWYDQSELSLLIAVGG
ncbi:DUF6912 family protein [Kineococcus rubinsiae]|uniref:DUF6912 family protein n=1 Tax=Kineococcus rubinsiae TaxID=2609562 RepID=UPI001430A046|nr:hypothetical protein [Kineococcus rubinsiae]NIZ90795.1 hypothetical protein [Kineococcus rubinsiae]